MLARDLWKVPISVFDLDESQYIKKTRKFFKPLNQDSNVNSLWYMINSLDVCGLKYNLSSNFGAFLDTKKDRRNEPGTKNLVSPFILRRTKKQVLKFYRNSGKFLCDMERTRKITKKKSQKRNALLKPMVLALTKSIL
jgi:non-specific serine/threonine protein kinase